MIERMLLDTGPLVALFYRRDAHHKQCVECTRELTSRLVTCWPVIVEAAWLLRSHPRLIRQMLGWVDNDTFELVDLDRASFLWMGQFIEKYQALGAQLADAALMYLAERDGIETIFTLDRRDFSVYRKRNGDAVSIIP